MKTWRTLGWPGSSCAKVRLVRPQEFCFAFTSWRLRWSIWFVSRCYVLNKIRRGDFNPSRNESSLPSLCQGSLPRTWWIQVIRCGKWKHFTRTELKEQKCARLTFTKLYEWENSWEVQGCENAPATGAITGYLKVFAACKLWERSEKMND